MMSSSAEVIVAHLRHVTSAKATHVASAKATVSAATAAPGLRTGGNKTAGKQCACQNHHYSSSHHLLHISA